MTIDYANAAGAIVASRLACADDMPTREEVQKLLRESKGV
jgi:5-dehydro-2-deoxygluconokinase